MKIQPSLPEQIALPYRIRRSAAAQAMPLGGSESYRLGAIAAYLPWRGLVLTIALLVAWQLLALQVPFLDPVSDLGFWLALVFGLAACTSHSLSPSLASASAIAYKETGGIRC